MYKVQKRLKRYATSRKAPGSSLNEVMDFFFDLPNPSSRTMALKFTQSLTEMSSTISFRG
jgi:hypothetical protein